MVLLHTFNYNTVCTAFSLLLTVLETINVQTYSENVHLHNNLYIYIIYIYTYDTIIVS